MEQLQMDRSSLAFGSAMVGNSCQHCLVCNLACHSDPACGSDAKAALDPVCAGRR